MCCTHFCGITLICFFYSQDFLFPYKFTFAALFILCIADTRLRACLGPKNVGFVFFFKKKIYWPMIQSLHRLFVFQRVTPTPYNSALGAEHGVCSPSIHAHFVLACEPKRMTSDFRLRAVQPPLRLCPTECFTVSVPCGFGEMG